MAYTTPSHHLIRPNWMYMFNPTEVFAQEPDKDEVKDDDIVIEDDDDDDDFEDDSDDDEPKDDEPDEVKE